MRVMLNVGCGHTRPAGWINTDCSLNMMIQRIPLLGPWIARRFRSMEYPDANVKYLNLNKRWPFADGSVDVVYGSHVFEHLSLSGTEHFLKETWRVLKRGTGVLRLVVPDLESAAREYLSARDAGQPDAAKRFLYVLNLHLQNAYPPTKPRFYLYLQRKQDYPHQHKYMYDAPTMKQLLESKGFLGVRPSSYGQSELIPEIKQVEAEAEGIKAIYFEALRPESA